MSVPDWLLVTVQWVHHMGAIAWVGGMIFFRLVLQPALRTVGIGGDPVRTIGQEFGSIVRIAIGILIVTGAFLAVVHLGAGGNSRVYIGILALKIALALFMFLVVWLRRRSTPSENAGRSARLWSRIGRGVTGTTALLIVGVVVIGLADVLGAVGHGGGGHGHGSGGHSEVVDTNGHGEAPHDSDDHHADDDSDGHHESEKSVDGDKEDLTSPQPTKELQGEEADHHADDDGDGHHESEKSVNGDKEDLTSPQPTKELQGEEADHHADDDGDGHHESEKSVNGDKGDLASPQPTKEPQSGEGDHHGDDDGDGGSDENGGEDDGGHGDGHDHDH